jgi:hypothetical protein
MHTYIGATLGVLAVIGGICAIVYLYTNTPTERKLAISRLLLKSFAVLLAGSVILGMILKFGR